MNSNRQAKTLVLRIVPIGHSEPTADADGDVWGDATIESGPPTDMPTSPHYAGPDWVLSSEELSALSPTIQGHLASGLGYGEAIARAIEDCLGR